jgi:hypothetical protein
MERKRITSASHKSDAIKRQIIDFLMQGYSVQKAMDAVGRSVKTYEYYRKVDSEFSIAVDKVRSMTARGEIGNARGEVPPFPQFSEQYLKTRVFKHQQHWIDLLEDRQPTDVHDSITYEKGAQDLLIVNTPPEHAKSTTITVNYAVYRICQNPNIRINDVNRKLQMTANIKRR